MMREKNKPNLVNNNTISKSNNEFARNKNKRTKK